MIVAAVIPVLQALAAKIGASKEHPLLARGGLAIASRPVSDYLVTKERLVQNFNVQGADPARFLFDYIQTVRPRWTDLNANPTLMTQLGGLAAQQTATLQEAAGHSQLGDAAVLPIAGVSKNGISNFLFRLDLDQSIAIAGGGRVVVSQLVDQTVGTNFTLLNPVTDTPQRAADAIMKVRAFDDSVIRFLAAEKAAATVGRPLADVMTMYRQEGGFAVYPGFDSVLAGVPSATTTYETFLGTRVLPDLTHLIWVGDPTDLDLSSRSDPRMVEYATATCLYVNLQGMDRLGSIFANNDFSTSPQPWIDIFAAISDAWWAGGGLTSRVPALASGRQRWARSQAALKFKRPFLALDGQGPDGLLIAPADPVTFIALILLEGLGFYESFRQFADEREMIGSASFSTGMKYLCYNSQMDLAHIPAMMLSAAASAQVNRKPRYADLAARVNADAGLKALIKEVYDTAKKTNRAGITIATWTMMCQERTLSSGPGDMIVEPRLKLWLSDDSNMRAVTDFMETASVNDWPGWGELRSNLSRFRLARRFFERAFGDYVPLASRALT
ncbi:hypothetical protein [Hypericibacter sp.]|uniref:hypothetical protein n=1 Tax=Hypericibacter sp. TaxID=2705401 RepID=UPI003D6CBBD4